MRGYGHRKGESDEESEHALELSEMTISADPAHVRAVGEFLIQMASLLEAPGENFGGKHFRDFRRDLWQEGFVDVIVVREGA